MYLEMLRLQKSLSEKIYLLYANQISETQWDFKVRGQSKNIYQQTLTPFQFTCSCPDHKTKQTFCKHLLFLVARVAVRIDIASKLSNDKTLWGEIYFNLCSVAWIERLKSRMENENKPKTTAPSAIGNDCPVCFEEMKDGESLSQCITTCKNYFHSECIQLWLSSGHSNCPLCRATWTDEHTEENVEVILLPPPIKLEELETLQPQPQPKKRGRKKKTEDTTQPTQPITTEDTTQPTTTTEPVVLKKTRGRKKKTNE
jgi:Ring finger domain